MALELLLRGCLIGLVFGVPAGAIGALVIQRTLAGGFWNGFLTGLGSSAADGLYACAGVFGLTVVTDFLTRYQQPIGTTGAALVLLYGLWMIVQARKHGEQSMTQSGVQRGGFASAFVIAILNPATILSFMVAFSAFGIVGDYTAAEGVQLVLGGACRHRAVVDGAVPDRQLCPQAHHTAHLSDHPLCAGTAAIDLWRRHARQEHRIRMSFRFE